MTKVEQYRDISWESMNTEEVNPDMIYQMMAYELFNTLSVKNMRGLTTFIFEKIDPRVQRIDDDDEIAYDFGAVSDVEMYLLDHRLIRFIVTMYINIEQHIGDRMSDVEKYLFEK